MPKLPRPQRRISRPSRHALPCQPPRKHWPPESLPRERHLAVGTRLADDAGDKAVEGRRFDPPLCCRCGAAQMVHSEVQATLPSAKALSMEGTAEFAIGGALLALTCSEPCQAACVGDDSNILIEVEWVRRFELDCECLNIRGGEGEKPRHAPRICSTSGSISPSR